jgi:hypothetical protein
LTSGIWYETSADLKSNPAISPCFPFSKGVFGLRLRLAEQQPEASLLEKGASGISVGSRCRIFRNLFLFIDTFLCSPKEKYSKEKAPGVPLDPALLKTGGPFKNLAPKQRGPQTA